MDRSWMTTSCLSRKYVDGVQKFLDFAKRYAPNREKMFYCPCVKCFNMNRLEPWKIKNHLTCNGIDKFYIQWEFHG